MKKILIFSNGEKIGDGIIKLPFIYDLKKYIPNSKVTWLTHGNTVYKDRLKSLIINKIDYILDNANLNYIPFKSVSKKFDLKNQNYDLVIDTQKTLIKTLALKKIKTEIFISSCSDWLFSDMKPLNKNKKDEYYLNNIYTMLELYTNFKIAEKSIINTPEGITKKISTICEKNKKYFGVAPGAGEKNKKWPINNYIKLTEMFIKLGFKPCFFLGPDDKAEREILINKFGEIFEPEKIFPNISSILNVMSCTNFLDFAVCNDSGISHILSTGNCHLFKIFNNKKPTKFTDINNKIEFLAPDSGQDISKINCYEVFDLIKSKLYS